MSNLHSLLESANQWRVVQGDAARLASKWEKTGLLEGLSSETERNNMALILENQAKQHLLLKLPKLVVVLVHLLPLPVVKVNSGLVLLFHLLERYLVKLQQKILLAFNQ